MKITSAKFVKGVVGDDAVLAGSLPVVAFIGRSNVGKSSIINSLVNQKALARSSSTPGRTREINVYLVNNSLYLADLPGYGFTRVSQVAQNDLRDLIYWYLLDSEYKQKKVVLIIDAVVGPSEDDLAMLYSLSKAKKSVVIVVNKIDKLKRSQLKEQLEHIQSLVGDYKIIPYSAQEKIGVAALAKEILT
ncbi:MAG: ribosome biogenesis GTP-binding protein YihA/YsxC [Candidatus Veblenbacteria bacterium]|nr:ribosome biogenesis GTP-binding protein YihA/YsxC [Candidatus Veblenbacteria bacterium]